MEKDQSREEKPAQNILITTSLAILMLLTGCSSQSEVLYIIQACIDGNHNLLCDPDEVPVSDLIVTHRRGKLGIFDKYLRTDTEGQSFIDSRQGKTVSLELPQMQRVRVGGAKQEVCSPGFTTRSISDDVIRIDIPIPDNSCRPPGEQQSRFERTTRLANAHTPFIVARRQAQQ